MKRGAESDCVFSRDLKKKELIDSVDGRSVPGRWRADITMDKFCNAC